MARSRSVTRRSIRIEDHRRQLDDRRSRLAAIALKIRARRYRIVVEVEDARLEIVVEGSQRQAVLFDHTQQRSCNRMAGCFGIAGRKRITPPLDTNLAGHRL